MSESNDPEPVDAEFEPAPVEDEKRPRRGGTLGGVMVFLTATLAGGALGLTGAWWLDRSGMDTAADTETGAIIAALETRLETLEAANPVAQATEAVERDYAALRDRVERLETSPPVVIGEGDPQTLSALETRVTALEAEGSTESEPVDLTALTDRLDTIAETAERAEALANQALDSDGVGPMEPALDPAILQDLSDRLAALESAEPASQSAAVDLTAIETRLAAAEALAQSASDRADAATGAASTAQESGVETQMARTLAARTLALMALSEIAETSEPFEAERAALARLWRNRSELTALQSMARAGVPDREGLATEFPRDAIEAAAGPGRAFFGLIEVRRTNGNEAGDGPLALAALAEARLDRGDLEGAVAATERLEGEPLEAARSWLLGAQARLQIEAALGSLRAALVEEAAETGEDPR
tara:strand:+ start:724 stop:1983 length:1260 start_codon:yes stop_codon:yes gene_type:complete